MDCRPLYPKEFGNPLTLQPLQAGRTFLWFMTRYMKTSNTFHQCQVYFVFGAKLFSYYTKLRLQCLVTQPSEIGLVQSYMQRKVLSSFYIKHSLK